MAEIDDKVRALEFTKTTSKTRAELRQLFDDASDVAQPEKIVLTDTPDGRITGVARNFARVQHAAFVFILDSNAEGTTTVQFTIPDYLRTRETLLYFIPITPWGAPAYKTLREFGEYIQAKL